MVQNMVRQWWQELKAFEYAAWLSTAVVVVLLLLGIWNGYRWYTVTQEQKAQFAMSEAFEEYDRAVYRMVDSKEKDDQVAKQQLEDALLSLDIVTRNHGGSSVLPACAHAFKADIHWYDGKKEEALEEMGKAITAGRKTPLVYVWKTKLAMMKLDAGKQDEGIAELNALALDEKNMTADRAAFELGYYYWCNKDESNARAAWKLLEKFDAQKDDSVRRAGSPYLAIAQMKLGHISE